MLKRHAFTLIEVIAVVVILGMLVGVASMNLRGHLNRIKMIQAVGLLEEADRFARSIARKEHLPLEMTFNRKSSTIRVRSAAGSASKPISRLWKLPTGITISKIRDAQGSNESHEKQIVISANGTSMMYAIGLVGTNRSATWLVMLGFSGQLVRMENDADVAAMFAQ
jgi:prepilin-type N-terminal cleavage/methylation domain-containing protein